MNGIVLYIGSLCTGIIFMAIFLWIIWHMDNARRCVDFMESRELGRLFLLIDLQQQMITNPWKKMLIERHFITLREECKSAIRRGTPVDEQYISSLLGDRIDLLRFAKKSGGWEERWLQTMQEILATYEKQAISKEKVADAQ